jgi:hypothetical protein
MMRSPVVSLLVTSLTISVAFTARADFIDHFANPNDIGIYKIPRTGSPKILVIPIVVEDQEFETSNSADWLDEIEQFYSPDAEGWTLANYWASVSLGRYTPEPVLAPLVRFPTCPPLGGHADCEIPRGGGFASGDLQGAVFTLRDSLRFIDEIITCATAGPGGDRTCTLGGGVDLHDFDQSGPDGVPDGITDGVILVSNAAFPGIALPIKDLSSSELLTFLGALPTFEYDGVTVGAVAVAGRDERPRHGAWVSAHELGHLVGFVDLYTETGASTDMPYTLMGGWFYAAPGSLLDGYSRAAAGFAHVIQASGKQTFTLKPAVDGGAVVKVGTGDEFFMVELREKRDDVDGDMSEDRGVVVERVRLQKRPSPEPGQYVNSLTNYVNDDPDDYFLGIEQADGLFDLERGRARKDNDDLFGAGDSIGPSDDTAPRAADHRVFSTNRFDGTKTDITITVTSLKAGEATVEIEAPALDDPCAEIEADLCGGEACVDGACGGPASPQIVPGDDCNCTTTSGRGAPFALSLACVAAALALVRRRRA